MGLRVFSQARCHIELSVVPTGLAFRGQAYPALKRRAIITSPLQGDLLTLSRSRAPALH
jgi:hypothetical protein